ncbi:hypothetical protein [Streptomyces venezuelae]|uniref:hypothetical protein n=1 Tax=Streptomyces venezuelae TaxID=54571 RepID=UPI003316A2A9
MNLHIEAVGLLALTAGLLVGHAVHKRTRAASGGASQGDLVCAIVAAVAVTTVLYLLFGGGRSAPAAPDFRPTGLASVSHQVSEVGAAQVRSGRTAGATSRQ